MLLAVGAPAAAVCSWQCGMLAAVGAGSWQLECVQCVHGRLSVCSWQCEECCSDRRDTMQHAATAAAFAGIHLQMAVSDAQIAWSWLLLMLRRWLNMFLHQLCTALAQSCVSIMPINCAFALLTHLVNTTHPTHCRGQPVHRGACQQMGTAGQGA